MSSGRPESAPVPFPADEVPVEELARQQGIRPVVSVEDMARPGLFDSDEEWEDSWPMCTLPGALAWREFDRLGHRCQASVSLRGRLTDPLRARLTGETWCGSFVTLGELTEVDCAAELGTAEAG